MNTFVAVAFFCTPEQELHSKAAGSGLLGSRQPKTPPKKGPPKSKQLLIPAHGRIFLLAFYFFCLCSCMVTLWCFLGTSTGGRGVASAWGLWLVLSQSSRCCKQAECGMLTFCSFSFYFLKPFLYHLQLCSARSLCCSSLALGWWVLQRFRPKLEANEHLEFF